MPQTLQTYRGPCYGYLPVDPVAAAAASYLVDLLGLFNGGIFANSGREQPWASSCRGKVELSPELGL